MRPFAAQPTSRTPHQDRPPLHSSCRSRFPTSASRSAAILTIWMLVSLAASVVAAPSAPAATLAPAQPPDSKSMAEMVRWHSDYRQRTLAVRRARVAFSLALDQAHPKLARPCRLLRKALADRLLGAIFPVPDRATDRHLRTAFGELRRAASSCRTQRPAALIYHLQLAGGAFGDVELTLRPYGLRP